MKLYALSDPVNLACARVAAVGDIGYVKCDACDHYADYPKPTRRTVEWLEGSSEVCSFVWIAKLIAEVFVTDEVKDVLQECGGGAFLPVEFCQDPELKKPRRVTRRTKPRVWLPYEGPSLSSLWVDKWVHVDLARSSLRLVEGCPVCGQRIFVTEGVEERKHRWDAAEGALIEIHKPRVPGRGIYVREQSLSSTGLFRLYEFPGRIFCTERVKTLIDGSMFTNVTLLEAGETVA